MGPAIGSAIGRTGAIRVGPELRLPEGEGLLWPSPVGGARPPNGAGDYWSRARPGPCDCSRSPWARYGPKGDVPLEQGFSPAIAGADPPKGSAITGATLGSDYWKEPLGPLWAQGRRALEPRAPKARGDCLEGVSGPAMGPEATCPRDERPRPPKRPGTRRWPQEWPSAH